MIVDAVLEEAGVDDVLQTGTVRFHFDVCLLQIRTVRLGKKCLVNILTKMPSMVRDVSAMLVATTI